MSENEPNKARVVLAHARPWLPFAALALVLMALWLAWSGWRQTVDDGRRSALSSNRDTAVQLTRRTLEGELERLGARMASAPVQAALAAGDLRAAGEALARDWPHLEHAEILPTDLVGPYAGLAEGGYGRVAVAEAALTEDRPVMWVVRDGDGARVALGAPARAGGAVVGVAYVRLPLARATAGLESVSVPSSTYLALRQGGFNLLERGDAAYAEACVAGVVNTQPEARARLAAFADKSGPRIRPTE